MLGGMLELGELSAQEHDAIGRYVVRMNIAKLVAVGPEARPIYNAAHLEGSWGDEATWVDDADAAEQILREELAPGDIVLFKSSNAAGMKVLGDKVAADVTGHNTEHAETSQTPSAGGGQPA